MAIVRFFRGRLLLRSIELKDDEFLVDAADRAGIDIPRNCGTCLVRLISGNVPYPEPLPPGLDEFLIEDGGILSCCMIPEGACDIDVIPPL